jgi:tetratricopeptide (TPR) repeat protein
MRRLVVPIVVAVVLSALPATTRIVRHHRPPAAPVPVVAQSAVPTPARLAELRDLDIAFWARRIGEDPTGAEDRMRLAALLLQRARETGSYGDVLRADTVARAAMRARPQRSGRAAVLLASSLMAQHRFADAYAVARRADESSPGIPGYQALRGEVALELGRYDEARTLFEGVLAAGGAVDASVAARVARWEEITGRSDRARVRLAAAVRAAVAESDAAAEQRAWFRLRLADHDLRHGRLAIADSLLRAALVDAPNDYRVLGTLARLEWMRGQWAASAQWGERAIGVTLDPATLGTLSDDYAALGDTARAAQLADAMCAAVLAQTGPLHRAWSLFLLDRGEDRRGVLARARRELRDRRDVYGWDVEAWALHAVGRDAEAWDASRTALAQGTEDATLEYHAGVIAAAIGRDDDARAHLARALAINPHFHPRQADDARRRLARVEPTLAAVVVTAPEPAR